jgi:hypothetical protein
MGAIRIKFRSESREPAAMVILEMIIWLTVAAV